MLNFDKLVRYERIGAAPIQHGQGAVWESHDLLFDRKVAVKEIRAELAGDATTIRQFKKEAAAGARLGDSHENIVAVFDLGQSDDILYFAMEWIAGGHLQDKCGKVTLERAKSIARQVSSGLKCAHESGLVHSDIAPANILHDNKSDTYKISDFGYLKILDSILVSHGSGPLPAGGRPYFMPPAHWADPSRINPSTDVYALAVSLYSLLTGATLPKTNGTLATPQVIKIRHEQSNAPDEMRQLLTRFIDGHDDSASIDDFRKFLDRVP